jgi:diacylglycerol O-acyltransferase / wax synthase
VAVLLHFWDWGKPSEMRLSPAGLLETGSRRLSALDASFLRMESSQVHMHVGWSAVFSLPEGSDRPTLAALRERVAGRLDQLQWCRWRLQTAPLGLSEPRWVRDDGFDLGVHVRALAEPDEAVGYEGFAQLRDELLSQPLDRSRPPWEIHMVPRLDDGRIALVGKIHHSLVDGIAALQIVGLVVDEPEQGSGVAAPPDNGDWAAPSTTGRQSALSWAVDEAALTARAGLGAARALTGAAIRPFGSARSVIRDARGLLSAAQADVLPRAPDSPLDVPLSPRRTLVGYHATRELLREARAAGGGTLNDIGLTAVAGAVRALAIGREQPPQGPFKAMVPVSMRAANEDGPGNRISMVYIQLPVDLDTPAARLAQVRAEMQRLKASGRAEGTETLYAVGGLVPAPLRAPVVKALSSPRTFNLTISQSPGPRGEVHVLGANMDEVYSVVPITERHALAIGMVRYRRELFIGCYADPVALPEVTGLPQLLEAELRSLAQSG